MITRIVKLTFKEESIPQFLEVFEEIREKIANFEGCKSLTLFRDKADPRVYFTYSIWDSEDALNTYHHSDFFADTWSRTKVHFDDKPAAWSLDAVSRVN